MKQTTDNKTLFQALSSRFFDKLGRSKPRAALAEQAFLTADRDDSGAIRSINLVFRNNVILEIGHETNAVVLTAPGNEFSRTTQRRMNKILSLVGIELSDDGKGAWTISSKREGQPTQTEKFRNHEAIDLNRDYSQSIYSDEQTA